jgi:hypothetical protein
VRRARDAACMRAKRKAYRHLVRESEKEGPLGRPGHRLQDNIKHILDQKTGISQTRRIWLNMQTEQFVFGFHKILGMIMKSKCAQISKKNLLPLGILVFSRIVLLTTCTGKTCRTQFFSYINVLQNFYNKK